MEKQTCFGCGMEVPRGTRTCPQCKAVLIDAVQGVGM